MDANQCPCCSGLTYDSCCKPFHDNNREPKTPLALMRSRYSAYAKDLPVYIQKTTHPKSIHFESNQAIWMQSIREFSKNTRFIRLEIFSNKADWVYFCAYVEQNEKPIQLIEKSCFELLDGRWKYMQAIHLEKKRRTL
jgi:SEC-C motif-containing protein